MIRHQSRAIALSAVGVLLITALAARAQAPPASLQTAQIDCLPTAENGVVRASVTGGTPGAETRLYFRWDDHGAFYWVEMEADGPGSYWGVPPKPERRNDRVEYYAEMVGPDGRSLGRSETRITPVENDCEVDLTPDQDGMAENLIVGETVPEQRGETVMGFLCDGIVSRVDSRGIRRADEICRACVIAWWERPEVIIPAAVGLVGAGFVLDDDDDEASPSRP